MPSIEIVRLDDNPHQSVHGLRDDTSTRGTDLDGATITVTYVDGASETLTWQAYDPYTFGGANGAGITMSYGFEWHKLSTTKPVASIKMDLQPAHSVFDTTTTTDEDPLGGSTPGSKNGFPFEVSPDDLGLSGKIAITYSGIVNLVGSPAEGDLYTTMEIDFSGLPGGGFLGDLNWNSDIDTMKLAGDLTPTGVMCLTRGTLILTEHGERPVETLRPGDRIQTQDNGYQQLLLPLSRTVGPRELGANAKLYPVRITAGALGAGLPNRDLIVSRQHRMVVRSSIAKRMFGTNTVLVAAIMLTELPGVRVESSINHVDYFHLIFDTHQIIYAHGAPTESFLMNAETQKTLSPARWEEITTLFPDLSDPDGCGAPARMIPPRGLQKRLIKRHRKNARHLISQ